MSNSLCHALRRRTRADQVAKEHRMHRTAGRNKHPLVKENPFNFKVTSAPPIKLEQPVAPATPFLTKEQILAVRKKPWCPWWKKAFGKDK